MCMRGTGGPRVSNVLGEPLPLATPGPVREKPTKPKCTVVYFLAASSQYLLFALCLLFLVLHLLFCFLGPLVGVCGEHVEDVPCPCAPSDCVLVIVCLGFALFQFCGFVSF